MSTTPRTRCDELGVCQHRACPHCQPAAPQPDEFDPLPLSPAELWAWRIAIAATYGASAALVVGAVLWFID